MKEAEIPTAAVSVAPVTAASLSAMGGGGAAGAQASSSLTALHMATARQRMPRWLRPTTWEEEEVEKGAAGVCGRHPPSTPGAWP